MESWDLFGYSGLDELLGVNVASFYAGRSSGTAAWLSLKSIQGTIHDVTERKQMEESLVLERFGYSVLTCRTADEALGLLQVAGLPIDLLHTDVVLPSRLQGNELAREAAVLRPRLPVLYMSGYTRDAIVYDGRLDEGVNYMEKPFTPEKLVWHVRPFLDSRPSSE